MLDSNFVDYVKIYCCSGKGGAGCLHFHREKFNSKGGPDGGNGGQGGHVIIRGDSNMRTLQSLKYRKHISAEDGQAGQSQNQTGSDGKNIILDVPIGTVARHAGTEELICEIVDDGKELILFKGGRGGKGNTFFATPTNRTPQHSQPGEPSIDGWVILELKLLADVGLVGFPNAGKSTLLSVISAAKPKIADYAFTTLVPSLGIVKYRDNQSFAMADIPGIIKGASAGKGLGLRFLRHIERNALLLFVIPADSFNIRNDYEVLLNELRLFNPELLDKRRLLAISKSDLLDDELREALTHEIPSQIDSIFISSITEKGLSQLKDAIWEYLYE